MFFLGALYLRRVLGYDALQIGLAFLPVTVAMGTLSIRYSERLVTRFGARAALARGHAPDHGRPGAVRARRRARQLRDATCCPRCCCSGIGAGMALPGADERRDVRRHAGGRGAGVGAGQHDRAGRRRARAGGAGDAVDVAQPARCRGGHEHAAALTGGYHLAFWIAAALVAARRRVLVLRRAAPSARRERSAAQAEERVRARRGSRGRAGGSEARVLSPSGRRVRTKRGCELPKRPDAPPRAGRSLIGRLSLTRQVALLSLLPIVALGLILARVLQSQIVDRTLDRRDPLGADHRAVGIQPTLTPGEPAQRPHAGARSRALDEQLSAPLGRPRPRAHQDLERRAPVVYSEDHSLIGRTPHAERRPERRARGQAAPGAARRRRAGQRDRQRGRARQARGGVRAAALRAAGPPAGVFEIYLSYKPIAAAVAARQAHDRAAARRSAWRCCGRSSTGSSRAPRAACAARRGELPPRPLRPADRAAEPHAVHRRASSRRAREQAPRRGGGGAADRPRPLHGINNTLGNANGDRVLREVARRLERRFGEGALVARLGGDEYAVLLPDATAPPRRSRAAAEEVQREPRARRSLLDEVALDIEASIGIAVIGEHADDAGDAAPARGRSRSRTRARTAAGVEVYSPEHASASTPARLTLLGQVRGALGRGEFVAALPAQGRPADAAHHGRRGAGALAATPSCGLLAPRQLHPADRADRADRPADAAA